MNEKPPLNEALLAVQTLLKYTGDPHPNREGLQDTPSRVLKSYGELFAGYQQDEKELFTTFQTDGYRGLIILDNIEMFSTCEHHMLPFVGVGHIAYKPGKHVVGISKLARVLDLYSRRLQIQERICVQVVECLIKYLKPEYAICAIDAKHFCMCSRGVNKQNSSMRTIHARRRAPAGSILDATPIPTADMDLFLSTIDKGKK